MKKRIKYSLFFGIPTLIILTVGIYFSFMPKDRFDEYTCKSKFRGDWGLFVIDNESIYHKEANKYPSIREETKNKIYADTSFSATRYTFYKRTNKLKIEEENSTYILECTKLN